MRRAFSTPINHRYLSIHRLTRNNSATATNTAAAAAEAAAATSYQDNANSIFQWSSTRQCLSRREKKNPATAFPAFAYSSQCFTTRIIHRCFTCGTRPASLASSPFDPEKTKTMSSPFARGGGPGQQQNTTATATTHAATNNQPRRRKEFVPRKAAVELTERARLFFKKLLSNPPRAEIIGLLLNYDQSTTGEPRMVFSFSFVTANDLERMTLAHNGSAPPEGVSLEVLEEPVVIRKGGGDGSDKTSTRIVPKSPAQSKDDGLPKLYVSGNAFLKVLGARVDVDPEGDLTPILFDKEGNRMDPNA